MPEYGDAFWLGSTSTTAVIFLVFFKDISTISSLWLTLYIHDIPFYNTP